MSILPLSAHPSHKLAYVFSASHGHEHPATIQWSLLYARDQVHKCFACCRAWRFSQKAQPGLDSGRSSLACDSFSCGEGRYCHVVLARYQGQSLFSRANKAVWITRDGVSAHQLIFCADSQISHQYLPNMFLGSGGNGKATSRLG
jgi:hypothetical protein